MKVLGVGVGWQDLVTRVTTTKIFVGWYFWGYHSRECKNICIYSFSSFLLPVFLATNSEPEGDVAMQTSDTCKRGDNLDALFSFFSIKFHPRQQNQPPTHSRNSFNKPFPISKKHPHTRKKKKKGHPNLWKEVCFNSGFLFFYISSACSGIFLV